MNELTTGNFLALMFQEGDIFIVKRTDCVSGGVSYEVQSERNEILFEVTEKWFNALHEVHKRAWEHLTPCGCVCYVIIPNGVEFDPRKMNAHKN